MSLLVNNPIRRPGLEPGDSAALAFPADPPVNDDIFITNQGPPVP